MEEHQEIYRRYLYDGINKRIEPLYERIHARLRDNIRGGRSKTEYAVPSWIENCKMWDVKYACFYLIKRLRDDDLIVNFYMPNKIIISHPIEKNVLVTPEIEKFLRSEHAKTQLLIRRHAPQ